MTPSLTSADDFVSTIQLATFSADLPSNAISDRAEFSRLFGLPNPGSYEAVGYEVALHSNSSKVLDILNHPLNRAHIINEVYKNFFGPIFFW